MSNKNNLTQLLENLLVEADPVTRPTSMADFDAIPQEQVSLDQAVDKYFIQYEREAIPTSEMFENLKIEELTTYLLEQEEQLPDLDLGADIADTAPEMPSVDDMGMDLSANLGTTPGDTDASAPPVVQTPRINLQDFSRSVARLVNNVQSLIDLKSVILNRAKRFVQNNYDERTANELMSILNSTYDLTPSETTSHQMTDTNFPQPRTGVTGPKG